MRREQMLVLVNHLAEAKSRQDVDLALQVLHERVVLETPAIGSVVRGKAAHREALGRFFASFPDYAVTLDRHLAEGTTMVCWGTARMTMTGRRFGAEPSGKRAELPVIIEFEFCEQLISRERFYYDLSELCAQSGISTDAARRVLFAASSDGTSPSSTSPSG